MRFSQPGKVFVIVMAEIRLLNSSCCRIGDLVLNLFSFSIHHQLKNLLRHVLYKAHKNYNLPLEVIET